MNVTQLDFSGEQIPAGLLQLVEVEHGWVEATKETENEEGHSVVAVLDPFKHILRFSLLKSLANIECLISMASFNFVLLRPALTSNQF